MVSISQVPELGFAQIVHLRNPATLLSIIQEHTTPEIISTQILLESNKGELKPMKCYHAPEILGYLSEFMWRDRHRTTAFYAFQNLIRDIAEQHGNL
ncbi:hypothetical protein TrispH2_005115 [Trichoplax sp. H2]|nr:hypothetical protein TrispH2_005115 [Trichoplax sp. H2]|eukprot:RDD41960.1 hypothetical protein TrispH2_005115 [Trichoplax sp. H2]